MQGNASISPKQRKLLTLLFQGSSIVDAAKECKVNESTAHRWLKLKVVQAEQERLAATAKALEEAEIERIMSSGYAAVHNRVQALSAMADLIKLSFIDEDEGKEKIKFAWVTPDKIREFRGCLDDIAKELGHRKIKQEIEHSGMIDLLNSEHAALLADLAELPDVSQKPTEDSATTADTA